MRIGIFVVDVGEHGAGLETYEVELLRGIARLDHENEYLVYCSSPNAPAALGIQQDNFAYRILKPRSMWLSLPLTLPVQLARDGVDFFHATMVPPPIVSKDYLLSILCFSSWAHPEFFEKSVARRLNFLLEIGIRKGRYLLCNSQNLLEDVRTKFKISDERLGVTHLGVSAQFEPRNEPSARQTLAERYGIDGPYVLFIGKNQERKNALGVVRAYARFRDATRSDAKLVLVGRGPEASGPINDAINEAKLGPHVLRVPYVPYDDLPMLYSSARMFVFPSFWEGFGLPVIEAMACGVPVVASNVTALTEVAGDAAAMVDPTSVSQIADAMIRIEQDDNYRDDLIARGFERKKQFTWDKCAQQTIDYYHRMGAR